MHHKVKPLENEPTFTKSTHRTIFSNKISHSSLHNVQLWTTPRRILVSGGRAPNVMGLYGSPANDAVFRLAISTLWRRNICCANFSRFMWNGYHVACFPNDTNYWRRKGCDSFCKCRNAYCSCLFAQSCFFDASCFRAIDVDTFSILDFKNYHDRKKRVLVSFWNYSRFGLANQVFNCFFWNEYFYRSPIDTASQIFDKSLPLSRPWRSTLDCCAQYFLAN